MALKRTIHEICPKCGQAAAHREGDRIRGWHDCPFSPPGPKDPPINFHINDVTFIPAVGEKREGK